MKAVIFAGGKASTIEDGIQGVPKPMALIGEKPILWHIMKNYSSYGIHDFIICGGYKVNMIKDYFADYYLYQSDVTIDLVSNQITIHKKRTENWTVTVKDTGLHTATGGRLAKVRECIGTEDFLVSYGDVLSNIDFRQMIDYYHAQNTIGMAAVTKPIGRSRLLSIDESQNLTGRQEVDGNENDMWTSAGIFLFHPKVFAFINGDEDLEEVCLKRLEAAKQIKVYKHKGYFTALETHKQKIQAQNLWDGGCAPWKVW